MKGSQRVVFWSGFSLELQFADSLKCCIPCRAWVGVLIHPSNSDSWRDAKSSTSEMKCSSRSGRAFTFAFLVRLVFFLPMLTIESHHFVACNGLSCCSVPYRLVIW